MEFSCARRLLPTAVPAARAVETCCLCGVRGWLSECQPCKDTFTSRLQTVSVIEPRPQLEGAGAAAASHPARVRTGAARFRRHLLLLVIWGAAIYAAIEKSKHLACLALPEAATWAIFRDWKYAFCKAGLTAQAQAPGSRTQTQREGSACMVCSAYSIKLGARASRAGPASPGTPSGPPWRPPCTPASPTRPAVPHSGSVCQGWDWAKTGPASWPEVSFGTVAWRGPSAGVSAVPSRIEIIGAFTALRKSAVCKCSNLHPCQTVKGASLEREAHSGATSEAQEAHETLEDGSVLAAVQDHLRQMRVLPSTS